MTDFNTCRFRRWLCGALSHNGGLELVCCANNYVKVVLSISLRKENFCLRVILDAAHTRPISMRRLCCSLTVCEGKSFDCTVAGSACHSGYNRMAPEITSEALSKCGWDPRFAELLKLLNACWSNQQRGVR